MCPIHIGPFCVTIEMIFVVTVIMLLSFGIMMISEILSRLPEPSPESPPDMDPTISFSGGLVKVTVHWRDEGKETLEIVNDTGDRICIAFSDQDFGNTSLPDRVYLEAGARLTIGMDVMPDLFEVTLKINGGEESNEVSRPE